MKEKYIEERFPRYFVFGGNEETGYVDVSSELIDPVATVGPTQARVLIKDRDEVLDMLVKVAQALDDIAPEKFNEIWYGGKQ